MLGVRRENVEIFNITHLTHVFDRTIPTHV